MAHRGTLIWHTLAQLLTMAWHTLNEAVKLTGRSRRSIYRDMATGLVSYGVDASGNRQFDTSELMRAYGALKDVAHRGTDQLAHRGTADVAHVGTEPWSVLLAELQALRLEVKELRATVLLIEHKPEKKSPEELSPSKFSPSEPATWADLLAGLDKP